MLLHKLKTDVFVDQPQQMVFRNLIFHTELVEQCFGTGVVPIMISRPPKIEIQRNMSARYLAHDVELHRGMCARGQQIASSFGVNFQ